MVRRWATKEKNFCTYLAILKAAPGKKQKQKKKIDFEKIFDKPIEEYLISKEFLEFIGYICSYLPKSE